MRPKTWTYTPADNSLTGYLSNATGATWTLTATTPNDGLAHQVTIRNDSATDHSAKTGTLVGTDADDKAITEVLQLPGTSATVTSTKYYKTLTSVVPSATIGADTMDIGWNDVAISKTIPSNFAGFNGISVGVVITGTISIDVQHTLNDVFDSSVTPTWADHASLAAITASADGNYAYPVTAIRLLVNSLTAGATVSLSLNHTRV